MRKRYETRKRARVAMEVITSSWDDALEFETSDMSPQGAFVQSEILPTVGEHIVCVFTLEGTKREFALFGEVARVNLRRRRSDYGRPGFGVRFLDATPLDRLVMRHSLGRMLPQVPAFSRVA
ncbi:MAG: PilZ domain-containing protein [Deltaproteobacteria bacterium]|nr:PilZ domain-containing protein [Deltaproteobacteria bacterium]